MTSYDRLRENALGTLQAALGDRGISSAEMEELTQLLGQVNFPAFLGVLGTQGKPTGQGDASLLHDAAMLVASRPEVAGRGVDGQAIESALTALFVHGAAPDQILADPAIRTTVLELAMEELGKSSGIPLKPAEAEETLRLISTGEFFEDAATSTAAVAFAVRNLPLAIFHDVQNPFRLPRLLLSLIQDLAGTPFLPLRVLEDLRQDGKLDHPPAVLSHTLATLFGFASVSTIAHTIGSLIQPENRSVRLAIVVYARINGIPLEESDLDLIRDSLLETDNPDLGPLLAAGVSRYLDHHGAGQLIAVLQRIAATNA